MPRHFTAWKKAFIRRNGREPSYNDLYGTEEYYKIKQDLLQEQGCVCCYCEKRINLNDCNIEHFMPRNPDRNVLTEEECDICRNAQLDYENLFASCLGEKSCLADHCNSHKGNWYDFRYCISPLSDQIEGIFGFRLNGKIFAVDNNSSAEQMKNHLHLDSYVLREQRKQSYYTVLELEFADVELLDQDDYIADTIGYYSEKDENGKYTPFCSMITYCLEHYL